MHGRLEASSQLVTHRRSTYWLLTVKELNECCIPYNTCTVTPVYFSYYFLTGTCTVPVRDGCEVRLCDPFPAPPGVFLPVQYRCSTGKQSMKPSTRAPLLLPVTTFYRYGTGTVGPTVPEHLQFNPRGEPSLIRSHIPRPQPEPCSPLRDVPGDDDSQDEEAEHNDWTRWATIGT